MIDRQHDGIVFECDGCDEVIETGMRAWPDAHGLFNREGWRAEKVGAEWTHLCPKCQRRAA